MSYTRTLENVSQWAKKLEERFLARDYALLATQSEWLEQDPSGYHQVLLPLMVEPQSIRNLLIFKPDEIGDCVFSLPALSRLREKLPHAKLFLLCQKRTRGLFERAKLFDEIVDCEPTVWLKRIRTINVSKALSSFSEKDFDVAVYLRTYRAYFRSFLKFPAKIKIHPRDPKLKSNSIYQPPIFQWTKRRSHQIELMAQTLAPVLQKRYSLEDLSFPTLHWTEEDRKALSLAGLGDEKNFVVIHPYAPIETRRYPNKYWNQITQALQEKFSVPIVVVGGASDQPFLEGDRIIHCMGKLSLSQSAYLISRAKAYLGNESGPLHLASALGVRSIGFFGGHSLASEWAPVGQSLVLRHEVPCAPCHRKTCAGYELACLTELTPKRVLPQLFEFLKPCFTNNSHCERP